MTVRTQSSPSYDRLVDARTAESLLTFSEGAGPRLRALDSKAVFAQLEQRYDDLLSALRWFIDGGRTDEALRLASSLVVFWMATKRLDEGIASLDRALGLPGGDDVHRGRALFDAGYLAFWKGDDERSAALQHRALELGRQTNDPTVTALALGGLARIALRASDLPEARRLCREALALSEGTSDRVGRSGAMHVLAVAAQMAGDLTEARELMSARIVLAREQGNFATISSEAGNLSMVERQLGNLERAEALAREALDIDYQRGDHMSIPWKVNGLAAVATDRGEYDRAASLIGIADATMEAAGGAWPPDEWQHYERTVATLSEQMGATTFEQARAAGRSMATPEAVEFALQRS
jgi:tetratricopeptide (TPR) repeat protein